MIYLCIFLSWVTMDKFSSSVRARKTKTWPYVQSIKQRNHGPKVLMRIQQTPPQHGYKAQIEGNNHR